MARAQRVAARFMARRASLPPVDLQVDDVEAYLGGLVDGIEDLDSVEAELGFDLRNLTKLMAKYPHNDDIHHNGEDVLTHTKWVLEDLHKLVDVKEKQKRQLLTLVALLHDVGKAYTYEVIEGKHTFRQHAKASVLIAEKMLAKLREENADLYQRVIDLIRLHNMFMQLINGRAQAGGGFKYLNKLMREAIYLNGHLDDLVTFSKADGARARRMDDTLEQIEEVLADLKRAEQQKCEEAEARERRQNLSPAVEAELRALFEVEAPDAVALLPNLKAVNRTLGQAKRYDLLKKIREIVQ
jgi:putative nucleotidyltransferase with HDIG domain